MLRSEAVSVWPWGRLQMALWGLCGLLDVVRSLAHGLNPAPVECQEEG